VPGITSRSVASYGNGANQGFEQHLWAAADKMRGLIEPSDFQYIILSLPLSTTKKPSRGRIQISDIAATLVLLNRWCDNAHHGNYIGRCPKCMKYSRYIDCPACGFTMDVR
jgi:hypothetical protein